MRIHARHWATGEPVTVTVMGQRVMRVEPQTPTLPDRTADVIGPAFFDIQINGAHGTTFTSTALTVDDVHRIVKIVRSHGTSGFCPTVITADHDTIAQSFRTLARACNEDGALAGTIPIYHLEGPYLSPDDGPRGAHPRGPIRDPDWDEFQRWQDAAGGRIRLVTLAPERPGAHEMIERLAAAGIVVSIGHTNATAEQIRAAIGAGARLSTHLGNGAHAVMVRHPNYIWEQLAADELWASIIPDGHHLSDSVLKCMLRMKTPARTVLISDASGLAGSPPGRHALGHGEFDILPEGKVVIAGTRLLAGAAVFLDACVQHVIQRGFASPADALVMASVRPRELLGLPVPQLVVGAPADSFVTLNAASGATARLGMPPP